MNLKRHHVLYVFLALSLKLLLIVFLIPSGPKVSFIPVEVSLTPTSSASSTENISYEVVTTAAAQSLGLGGRESIPSNYAMLFVFPEAIRPGFWMKDMLAPIDIIWLSDAGTILGIEDSVSPTTYPKTFYPLEPVKYVLETRAGEARKKGWEVGTRIQLPAPYGLQK